MPGVFVNRSDEYEIEVPHTEILGVTDGHDITETSCNTLTRRNMTAKRNFDKETYSSNFYHFL